MLRARWKLCDCCGGQSMHGCRRLLSGYRVLHPLSAARHPSGRHRTFPHPHFTLVLDIARFRVVPTSPLPHAASLASSPGPIQLNSSPVSYLFYLRFCPPAMLQKWDGEDTPRRNSHTKSYRKVIAFFDASTCRERRASGRKIENHLTTFPVDNLLKTTISSSR